MASRVLQEVYRQSVHFAGILVVLLTYVAPIWLVYGVIVLAIIFAMTHMQHRHHVRKIPIAREISDFFHKFSREDERKLGVYFGAGTFFFGLFLTLFFFRDLTIFRVAALTLILGDSFSTIVGVAWGKHKIPWNSKKSVEGALAFFVFTFLGVATQLPWELAAVIALAGAIIESIPFPVNDNLSVPVLIGGLTWLLLA